LKIDYFKDNKVTNADRSPTLSDLNLILICQRPPKMRPDSIKKEASGWNPVLLSFINHMHDSKQGMVKEHPRPGITHYESHPFTHIFFITMHLAFRAHRLIFPENAFFKPFQSIIQQFIAVIAKISLRMVIMPAIKTDHAMNGDLLSFYAVFHIKWPNLCHAMIIKSTMPPGIPPEIDNFTEYRKRKSLLERWSLILNPSSEWAVNGLSPTWPSKP
jgi:hypothetical protein